MIILSNRLFPSTAVYLLLAVFLTAGGAFAQELYFDPDPTIPVDPVFAVPLHMQTGGLDVKGIEVNITFDQSLVRLDSVSAGPWYTDAGQDFFFWDYTAPSTSAIHFASAMLDGTRSQDGVVAYCHFTILDFGVSPLDFTEVDVRDVDNSPLGFTGNSGSIILDPAIENQPIRFSTLKAIYR